jgi:pyridoxal phosphate enzyme (YggS family)
VAAADDTIRSNLAAVRARLERAARAAGRDPAGIRLVAISKTFPPAAVRAAFAAGQTEFGENRVQEALAKIEQTADLPVAWHLVGHLQSNKARRAAASFAWIHSVDSLDLLMRIDAAAADTGAAPALLIQVDLAGEAAKSGAAAGAVPAMLRAELRAARLRGLMLLPPYAENPEDVRPWFRRLRELRDRLLGDGVPADRLAELSMGMSHDFEVALQEGATMVRVGTAIFGERRPGAGTENGR